MLTIHTRSAPDTLPTLYRELTAIEVFTRPRDDVPDCLRSGLEVRKEACGLDVGKVVLGVWTRLENEDAQGWVRSCEPSDNYPSCGSA